MLFGVTTVHGKSFVLGLATASFTLLLVYNLELHTAGMSLLLMPSEVDRRADVRLSQDDTPTHNATHVDKPAFDTANTLKIRGARETATRMLSLILNITRIHTPAVVEMLNRTLQSSSADLRPALASLETFYAEHACPHCVDARPLPRTVLDATLRLDHPSTRPVLILTPNGRLGNLMGEYASLLALTKIYNVTVYMAPAFSRALDPFFAGLSLPSVSNYSENAVTLKRDDPSTFTYHAFQLAAAGLLGQQHFLLQGYPFQAPIFNAFREDIVKEFTFERSVIEKARRRLLGFSKQSRFPNQVAHPIYVGVHVRLTDYPNYMKQRFSVSDVSSLFQNYLTNATAHFLELFPSVVFAVTSDDPKRTKAMFQNMTVNNTFVSKGSAIEDLCLLSLCNHTIMTFGTYGFWAAYLSGGITTYPHVMSTSLHNYPFTTAFFERSDLRNFVPINVW